MGRKCSRVAGGMGTVADGFLAGAGAVFSWPVNQSRKRLDSTRFAMDSIGTDQIASNTVRARVFVKLKKKKTDRVSDRNNAVATGARPIPFVVMESTGMVPIRQLDAQSSTSAFCDMKLHGKAMTYGKSSCVRNGTVRVSSSP
mmetsp:Transcript_13332/g.37539  ORF Transcript_13332/g.37539 Transcript_13332/m.37539 type:complete len:143 (+) Transcript_13332:1205-1633(+)